MATPSITEVTPLPHPPIHPMARVVENPLGTKAVSARLNPVRRLLLGPGPQNADPRVHAAMSLPQIGHMDADFLRIVEDIKHLLR